MSVTYVRIGTDTSGRAAYTRPQVAVMWALFVELVALDMGIDMARLVVQSRGGAAASAGTHSDGAAIDTRVHLNWRFFTSAQRRRLVLLARECGFQASWDRPWTNNQHLHLGAMLRNLWTRVTYQCTAVRAGFNGLGAAGRGGRDDGPKPSAWRDHISGPTWARNQIAALKPAPVPAPEKPAPDTRTDLERLLDTMNKKELGDLIYQKVTEVHNHARAAAVTDSEQGARAALGRVPSVDSHNGIVDSSKTWALNTALRVLLQQAAIIKKIGYQIRASVWDHSRRLDAIEAKLDKEN